MPDRIIRGTLQSLQDFTGFAGQVFGAAGLYVYEYVLSGTYPFHDLFQQFMVEGLSSFDVVATVKDVVFVVLAVTTFRSGRESIKNLRLKNEQMELRNDLLRQGRDSDRFYQAIANECIGENCKHRKND